MQDAAPLSLDDLTSILFGHSAFQYLNAGMELGMFRHLHDNPHSSLEAAAISTGLPKQSIQCLLFGLTALRLVTRDEDAYSNCLLIEGWIQDENWEIMASIIRFESKITYLGQSDFVESLRTGSNVGIRHIPGDGRDLYHRLSQTPELSDAFYNYMGSWSRLSIPLMLESIDFSDHHRLADIGGGDGTIAIAIAQRYPQMEIILVDLQSNCHIAQRNIDAAGLGDRIRVWAADMFYDPLPTNCDCFIFVHQLVIWPHEIIERLLSRAYYHLPDAGKVVIFNSMSSDSQDGPLMAALDSVYFVSIPAEGGMIHPWKVYEECLRKSGFVEIKRFNYQAWTPHGTIVATKAAQEAGGVAIQPS